MTSEKVTLVPRIIGPEKYEIHPTDVRALEGTGFDPANRQHTRGSDAARYAIAIQQFRDAGRYDMADEARNLASKGFVVMQGKGFTAIRDSRGLPFDICDGVAFDGALCEYLNGGE